MGNKFTRVVGHKVRLGKVGLPVWAIGLVSMLMAGLLIAVASGQVGKALSGETSGTFELVVEQAVVLDTDRPLGTNPDVLFISGAGQFATSRDDTGTLFTVAIEMHQAQTAEVTIFLDNRSGTTELDAATVVLELDVPDKIHVAVKEQGFGEEEPLKTEAAQMTPTTWLLVVPGGKFVLKPNEAGDGFVEVPNKIVIQVKPTNVIEPGFYTIGGRLIQLEGG